MTIKKMDHSLLIFVSVICVTNTSSLYAEGSNRILNGSPASENQFPYMISLQQLSEVHSVTRGHKCGGVLVTLQHALTSAKCLIESDGVPMVPINPAAYRVFAGSVFLTNDNSIERVRHIAKITIHPDYDTALPANQPRVNDIGFIILGSPFSANTVTPLAVAEISLTEVVQCILSGWGMRGASATVANTQLMYAQMPTIVQNTCSILVNSHSLVSTQLCAWAPSIQGVVGCEGDRGGPLMCRNGLAGILIDIGSCRITPSRPQLFTRVSNYTAWIDSVVSPPIPEVESEPPTVASPTTPATSPTSPATSPTTTATSPTTTATSPTTTATSPGPPAGATISQPVMAVLVVIVIVQVITANAINTIY
ncbi:hypothetical protein PYW08_001676 [Mythimna loreyi]|uniref:Uncharacterized protein n=1 Tax=Mythimna loreyi TaxID=667449 RepID=A0ACC2R5B4_9NEOP|nr:hypothetical protein PYW08_001676 [Mythimna loreyi]